MATLARKRLNNRTDALALLSYVAASFSLTIYGIGIIYCTWAITENETRGFLTDSLTPILWQTIWAFDWIMYAVGIVTAVIMMIGLLFGNRLSLLPWVFVSSSICAKHLFQLLAVIAFAHQNIPTIISSVQFAIALVLAMFIFVVLIKYDQMSRARLRRKRHLLALHAPPLAAPKILPISAIAAPYYSLPAIM